MRTELFQVRLGSGERLVAKDVGQAHGLPTSSRYSLLLSDVNRVANVRSLETTPDRRAFHKLTWKRVHNGRGRLCSLVCCAWQVARVAHSTAGAPRSAGKEAVRRTDGPVVRPALGLKTSREIQQEHNVVCAIGQRRR